MTRVSNIDHLVVLLRQRLVERTAAKGRAANASQQAAPSASALEALLSLEDVEDRQLRRAFIQDVLAERLGRHLLNEAKFQQIVERVTEALERDAQSGELLENVVSSLRKQARSLRYR